MEKGYMEAINALGEVILQQKDQLKYKNYELEAAKKEVERLREKIKAVEQYCEYYEQA